MIYATYIFGISGLGKILSFTKDEVIPISPEEEFDNPRSVLRNEGLVCPFLTAIRGFSHEFYENLRSIGFVQSKMILLPSQELYVLVVHASEKYRDGDLVHYLELIRDFINENYWDEIHDPNFFASVSSWITPFHDCVKEVMENKEWLKC